MKHTLNNHISLIMKKLLLFLTVALAGNFSAFAQSTLVGTLSHDGEVSIFYGADALIKAHEAATPGDVITLSAGTFAGVKITKAVTIRGTGMFPENNGTIISGSDSYGLEVNVEPSTSNLNLEGLYFSSYFYLYGAESPTFTKCQFGRGYSRQTSSTSRPVTSPSFINCFFMDKVEPYCDDASSFTNCYFNGKITNYGGDCSHIFSNCVFSGVDYFNDNCAINNSIIFCPTNNPSIRTGAVLKSCKICTDATDILRYCTAIDTEVLPFKTECFKEGSRYELTDDLVGTWLGDDGKQLGLYGGFVPFDPTPTNPQITKFNVANKTSADGKLSVDIEVSAAQ